VVVTAEADLERVEPDEVARSRHDVALRLRIAWGRGGRRQRAGRLERSSRRLRWRGS
jgi:hypothetical protein